MTDQGSGCQRASAEATDPSRLAGSAWTRLCRRDIAVVTLVDFAELHLTTVVFGFAELVLATVVFVFAVPEVENSDGSGFLSAGLGGGCLRDAWAPRRLQAGDRFHLYQRPAGAAAAAGTPPNRVV